ncbi:MAG TPA: hypothetical protein VGR19_12525 [Allosphingosinicella sp.]|nr:hypothetical protein [Allosphingosinicella sp.]
MSATKDAICEEHYLMDIQSVMDVVGLPEDIIEAFIARGCFPAPRHEKLWFGPEVFEWLNNSDGPSEYEDELDDQGTSMPKGCNTVGELPEDPASEPLQRPLTAQRLAGLCAFSPDEDHVEPVEEQRCR